MADRLARGWSAAGCSSKRAALAAVGGVWSHLPFPLTPDKAASVAASGDARLFQDGSTTVSPVSQVTFDSVALVDDHFRFRVPASTDHGLSTGSRVVLRKSDGGSFFGTVSA